MSKLKIEMDLDNADFEDDRNYTIQFSLAKMLSMIERGLEEGPMRDINGSKVGSYTIVEEED